MEQYRSVSPIRHVGILGGTFDPIHYGHLVIAEEVRSVLELTEMVFIPTGHPPHKPGRVISAAEHRVAMVELAIASNSYFSCSLIEVEQPGPSYTVDTLRRLRTLWGTTVALYFVIGWDSLDEFHTWYDPQGILAQLTHLVAVRRPGYEEEQAYKMELEEQVPGITEHLLVIPAPQLEISSTDLRQRVQQGRPIRYQTPESVEQYIAQHHLYGE